MELAGKEPIPAGVSAATEHLPIHQRQFADHFPSENGLFGVLDDMEVDSYAPSFPFSIVLSRICFNFHHKMRLACDKTRSRAESDYLSRVGFADASLTLLDLFMQ
jgi:hypothetical protein